MYHVADHTLWFRKRTARGSKSSPAARFSLPFSPGHVIIVILIFVAQASTARQTAVDSGLTATSVLALAVSVHGLTPLLFLQHPLSVASFAFQRVRIFRGVRRFRLSFRSTLPLLVGFIAVTSFGPSRMTTRRITVADRLGSITPRSLAILVTVPFTIPVAMSLAISIAVSISITVTVTVTIAVTVTSLPVAVAVAISVSFAVPVLVPTAGRILTRPMIAANPACKVALYGLRFSRNGRLASAIATVAASAASSVTTGAVRTVRCSITVLSSPPRGFST